MSKTLPIPIPLRRYLSSYDSKRNDRLGDGRVEGYDVWGDGTWHRYGDGDGDGDGDGWGDGLNYGNGRGGSALLLQPTNHLSLVVADYLPYLLCK